MFSQGVDLLSDSASTSGSALLILTATCSIHGMGTNGSQLVKSSSEATGASTYIDASTSENCNALSVGLSPVHVY